MKLVSLEEIFNSKIFRIPDYQRGYSWKDKQLNDIWSDIELLRNDQKHYTGVLSVIPIGEEANKTVHVVDGQQRLITMVILIKVICDLFDSDDDYIPKVDKEKRDCVKRYLHFKRQGGTIDEIVLGYEVDNPSHVYFKTKILGLTDTENCGNDTLYTRNLTNAKNFFAQKLKGYDKNQAGELFYKITKRLQFNYYEIDDTLNEFVAFETMNNRGKPLSDLELLKNRLIYLSTLLPDNSKEEQNELRKDINNAWKTVYEFLGKNPQQPLSDDDFLQDHWILNFKYSRESSRVYKDALLLNHFTAKQVQERKLSFDYIREYVLDIQNTVKAYYYMRNLDSGNHPYSENVREQLSKLNHLRFRAWGPLVMSILSKSWNDDTVIYVLKLAERFNFIMPHVQFRRSNYKNTDLYNCAREIHASSTEMTKEQVEKKMPYEITTSIRVSRKKFKERVYENDEAFYEWSGLRYFLYEYELKLQKEKRERAKVSWDNVNQNTIEHISPQNPLSGQWVEFDPEDFPDIVHDIGNLLLLDHKKNASLSNKPFLEKRDHEKYGYRSGSYSAIEVAKENEWTPRSVDDRSERLLNFMWERWEIEDKITPS